MSLDTVLKIGKAFRASEDGLKYFKYIKQCPIDSDKSSTSVLRLSLPIRDDFTIDFDKISEITDQNIIGSESTNPSLHYLTFKTSDNDSTVKYIFGDIYYAQSSSFDKNDKLVIKENGFYKLDSIKDSGATQINSFHRGKGDFDKIAELLKNDDHNLEENVLIRFRNNYESKIDFIHRILKYQIGVQRFLIEQHHSEISFTDFLSNEKKLKEYTAIGVFETIHSTKTSKKIFSDLLKIDDENFKYEWNDIKNNEFYLTQLISYSNSSVFLHFSFPEQEHWYNFKNELAYINQKMLDDFVDKSSSSNGYVLKKTLYKTLCSGDSKNDIQFPGFELSSKHKSKSFTIEEIRDLFYAIDYAENAVITPTNDIKIIVLPNGNNLTAADYENFRKEAELRVAEQIANRENIQSNEQDILFAWFDDKSEFESNVTQFDMIFSKKGGKSSPDIDLVELSGIAKSSLQFIKKRLGDISKDIYDKRQRELRLNKQLSLLSISLSFFNILGLPLIEKKGKVSFKTDAKYQSHLLKVLPRIYTSNYTSDNLLLPSFINNVEYSIRHGDAKFSFLKYDLEFLLSIQNTVIPKQNFQKIMSSKSYELGKSLGKLAIFLKPDKNGDSPINSFEKEFVGNLSRHIGQLRDVQKFSSYLFEKFALHKEKAKYIPFDVRTGNVTKEIEEQLMYLQDFNNKVAYDKHECSFGFFTSYFAPYEPKVSLIGEKEIN